MDQFATLDELNVGVVTIFQPSDAELVGHYLYNQVFTPSSTSKQIFPEICIYGKDALPPWEIWRVYQQSRFPNQDFIYFFSPAEKMNPNKARHSRRVGTDGKLGTWSEVNSFHVDGVQEVFGTLRKFRYEKKKNKKEVDITDEHHGAWLMDEFTINHAPDLALCRIKVNEKGGDRGGMKRKNIEEDEILTSKKRKGQNSCTTSQQMPSSYFHQDDQVVVPENNFPDELAQILMSDDDDDDDENLSPTAVLWNEAELRACVAQSIPNEQHSVVPQQQLGPDESSSSQEEYAVQLPQPDQASSSHSNEQQQLLADNHNLISMIDFDSLDDTCLQSINGLFTDEDQPSTQLWWHLV
uniref:NAC domain-containing protein 2-like isoform X5 n=1 Tax=Fragaria vesca subsp. vesca TaxID=101020 RepID=UPI0005CA2982|nr:PREDICTED: NAC domain-containing protein 2-like isoform X5 [Fragaria vesca subsp. vesca]